MNQKQIETIIAEYHKLVLDSYQRGVTDAYNAAIEVAQEKPATIIGVLSTGGGLDVGFIRLMQGMRDASLKATI
jgi:hypothetical protein